MPIFEYKAFTPDGSARKGIIEADTPKNARGKLKKQNLMVTEIWERSASGKTSGGSKKASGGGSITIGRGFSTGDIALLARQLASLIKASIPLVEALTALVDQLENEKLKIVIDRVRQDVNEGSGLAKAMAKHPKVFDHVFINMVEAGESSGTLGLVLVRLADLKEAQARLKGKMISSMTYPSLMVVVAVGLMIGIFTLVIPELTKIFASSKKELPPVTKILIMISGEMTLHWYIYLGAVAAFLFFFLQFIKTTNGLRWWDGFKLRMPLFGPIIRMIEVTRFATTMSTLLSAGVPILQSLQITRNLVGNTLVRAAIDDARENITEGQSIAEPLRRSGQFQPLVIHMISIGEKTGELPEMLKNVAGIYEQQVNTKIDGMTALLEPMMIVFMGGVVGFIVYSVFMPIMEMANIK